MTKFADSEPDGVRICRQHYVDVCVTMTSNARSEYLDFSSTTLFRRVCRRRMKELKMSFFCDVEPYVSADCCIFNLYNDHCDVTLPTRRVMTLAEENTPITICSSDFSTRGGAHKSRQEYNCNRHIIIIRDEKMTTTVSLLNTPDALFTFIDCTCIPCGIIILRTVDL